LLEYDFDFYVLQTEIRADDETVLAESKILSYIQDFKTFTETAAFITEMDLVISVDTSVAHLTGALGKPIWIMLPIMPDFRWLLEREDSPWYPTARLFRQQELGDWEGVIEKVKQALGALILPDLS
jgi:ADP-heptose:LPS heptosyltransferase